MNSLALSLALFFIFSSVSFAQSSLEKNVIQRPEIVAIDIGHTRRNFGATSARGKSEFSFNQTIALKLHSMLVDKGLVNSFVINPKGAAIKLKKRTEIAHEKKADVFISIHHDSAQLKFLSKWRYKGKQYLHGEKFKGFSLFVSDKTEQKQKNLALAEFLGTELINNKLSPTLHHAMPIKGEGRKLLNETLGIYAYPELAVLRTAKIPAVLVECGVIVNKDEELLLSSDTYQDTITKSLADGILAYLDSRIDESSNDQSLSTPLHQQ